jgi:hypothetical protein
MNIKIVSESRDVLLCQELVLISILEVARFIIDKKNLEKKANNSKASGIKQENHIDIKPDLYLGPLILEPKLHLM